MSQDQRTSVEELRKQLKGRFQDELVNGVQGPSDTLVEMVCDPMDMEQYPLFLASLCSGQRKGSIPGRRGPSRSGGAAPETTFFPPLTSRGVTKRNQVNDTTNTKPNPKKLGGYDGGMEIGFNGTWNDHKFKTLLDRLEHARASAENEGGDDQFINLGDYQFSVMPHGANVGSHYKYVLQGMGMKIYLHANPKGPIQPLRIRYGFESLVGRDPFSVHAGILELLQNLGFQVAKETLSRVDLQVMLLLGIDQLMQPIFTNRCVKRAQKSNIHCKNSVLTSFTVGSMIQLCIYDKRRELLETGDEVKAGLIINECLGGEFPEELTRVEFRLRREALKHFGVNTMQDLLEKEHALVDYLTYDWFRLLDKEKAKGNETRQELHPVWQQVRDLFFEYFPSGNDRKPVDHNNSRRQVKCTGESLIKQAVGCMATAAALAKGVFETEAQAVQYMVEVATEKVKTLFHRTRERAVELGIIRGVEAPDCRDWHLDPRYACESTETAINEYRLVWDEDLQYERFRQTAVAGCPF